MDTTQANTGQGAPAEVTSRTFANRPHAAPRAFTLGQIIDAFMAGYAGHSRSIGSRLAWWLQTLGDRPAAEITHDDVADALAELSIARGRTYLGRDPQTGERRFKSRRHAALAPATVNRFHSDLGSLYRWAKRRRLLPRGFVSPSRGIERLPVDNARVRYLDQAERDRLLKVCRVAPWSRLYLLVLMAITSGARRGELLALRWHDLDLDRRTAYVKTSKNGEPRVLVLVASVMAEIQKFRSRRPDDYVFASDRRPGRPMRIERAFREACAAARIENFRFHDLRHTCASYLAQNGASLLEVADVLGHRQLAVVKRYAHLSIDSKAKLAERVFAEVV